MSDAPLMTCGCTAQGTRSSDGAWFCIIHETSEIATQKPDLSGRLMKCRYDNPRNRKHPPSAVPSDPNTHAFFEFMGVGSSAATGYCKHCGCTPAPHEGGRRPQKMTGGKCYGFVPHGPHEFDSYYCGCMGWD